MLRFACLEGFEEIDSMMIQISLTTRNCLVHWEESCIDKPLP